MAGFPRGKVGRHVSDLVTNTEHCASFPPFPATIIAPQSPTSRMYVSHTVCICDLARGEIWHSCLLASWRKSRGPNHVGFPRRSPTASRIFWLIEVPRKKKITNLVSLFNFRSKCLILRLLKMGDISKKWQRHTSFFCDGFFEIVSQQLFAQGWLWTSILPISASWVAGITSVSHWCPAGPLILEPPLVTSFFNLLDIPYIPLLSNYQ
jgi:hypothetical protein